MNNDELKGKTLSGWNTIYGPDSTNPNAGASSANAFAGYNPSNALAGVTKTYGATSTPTANVSGMTYSTHNTGDWTPNGTPESGHDFLNQISGQGDVIANKSAQYGQQTGNIDSSRQAYEQAVAGQTAYGDLYDQYKQKEGVDDARAQYQKSLNAVNATNSAMNTLPSAINAGSNVVLNSAQRNAALGNQMAKYQTAMDYWTRQNAGDQSMYQMALASAQDAASKQMAQEQTNITNAMNYLQTNINQANALYEQLLQERQIMRTIYGQMYEDEYQHMQDELARWTTTMQDELARYKEEQANYRAQLSKSASDYATDIQKYLGSGMVWNGEGWESAPTADQDALDRAAFQDRLDNLYAQYQGELADLRHNEPLDYINFFSAFSGNSPSQRAARANEMESKGFEDYLYNASPALQKDLREKYSDLLNTYGIWTGGR